MHIYLYTWCTKGTLSVMRYAALLVVQYSSLIDYLFTEIHYRCMIATSILQLIYTTTTIPDAGG